MEILLSSICAGLMFGMILALVALGLTIIFGVMDIVNFAHGEFLMIGMYTGLPTAQITGVEPLFTLPLAAAVGFLLGIVCYTGFVRFLLRGPMIAQLLGWPQATFISELKLEDGNSKATCIREVDGGLETVSFPLPAIITADLRLNEPRYASLPGIMKARKKPLEEIAAADLGVDLAPKVAIKSMAPPPARAAGRKVADVDELIKALQTEAKVL